MEDDAMASQQKALFQMSQLIKNCKRQWLHWKCKHISHAFGFSTAVNPCFSCLFTYTFRTLCLATLHQACFDQLITPNCKRGNHWIEILVDLPYFQLWILAFLACSQNHSLPCLATLNWVCFGWLWRGQFGQQWPGGGGGIGGMIYLKIGFLCQTI
jgi:hypothetical protein